MNLLMLAGLWVGVQGSEGMSMDEAIQSAMKDSFSVKIAVSNLEKTRQKNREAKASVSPQLKFGATYTRFDKATIANLNGNNVVISPIDSKQAQFTLSFPIDITGVVGYGVAATREWEWSSMHAVEIAKNDLRLNVRNAFLSVLEADAQVKVLEESRARAEERLRKATAELNAGTSARVDVLRFETQLKQAEVDLFAGKNSLQLAKNSFNNTLARPIETPVQLSTAHIGELITDETLVDTLVAHALKFRPELKSVRYQLMALRNIRKATEGGLKPSLSFNATHQRNIDAQGFSSKSTSTFGTLALSLPLFDSGLTRAKVKQAREDEYQATQQLAQAELGISLDVRQAYTNYLFASQRLALATKAEESALETHRISKLRNDVHEGIVLEVIDSQTELTRAKTAVVLATYDQLKALAALQHALGTDGLIGGEQK